MTNNYDTIIGTAGGTLLSVIAIPSGIAISSTIILALIGAVTGFLTTLLCKKIYNYFTKKKK